jgi:hypothetical protein
MAGNRCLLLGKVAHQNQRYEDGYTSRQAVAGLLTILTHLVMGAAILTQMFVNVHTIHTQFVVVLLLIILAVV